MMPDQYAAPQTWAEMTRLKRQLQVDLLTKAARQGQSVKDAAASIGLTDSHFRSACHRLRVNAFTGKPM